MQTPAELDAALPFPGLPDPAARIELRPEYRAIAAAVERAISLAAVQGWDRRFAELLEHLRLAVTEVLNNVIEHSGHPRDRAIALHSGGNGSSVWVCVEDAGGLLPEGLLGLGNVAAVAGCDDLSMLSEGGWGWVLIRASVDRLDHVRREDRNYTLLVRTRPTGMAEL